MIFFTLRTIDRPWSAPDCDWWQDIKLVERHSSKYLPHSLDTKKPFIGDGIFCEGDWVIFLGEKYPLFFAPLAKFLASTFRCLGIKVPVENGELSWDTLLYC